MQLALPHFKPSRRDREWVSVEIKTAQFLRSLWGAANNRQRRDAEFVSLLVRCGWTNLLANGAGWESTRIWRNENIADYLQVDYESDQQLAADLSAAFPRLKQARRLLMTHTGITHYYTPLRPETIEFVEHHAKRIAAAFAIAASSKLRPRDKIKRAVRMIEGLGLIDIRARKISPLNGLSPALACLDPYRRLPIINDKTRRLLRAIGHSPDPAGALALHELIGRNGIKNSFELDVYAATEKFPIVRKHRTPTRIASPLRDVGLKSEIASIALIAANRVKFHKAHNRLTNRLLDELLWRQVTPKESRFDALILDYRKGRHLLIEAKTASVGPTGRSQIRQAIGQLFDYRHTHASQFPPGAVDLAVLLPSKPGSDVRDLLRSLKIELLWFDRKALKGTVEL